MHATQHSTSDIPVQTPLEGALSIASDNNSPLKDTFVGNVIEDLADTAKLASTPFRRTAQNSRQNLHENAPSWVFNNSARLIAGAHIAGEASYMFSSGQLKPLFKVGGFNGSIDSENAKFVENEVAKRVKALETSGKTVTKKMKSSLTKEVIESEKGLEKLYAGLGKFRGWDRSWAAIKATVGDKSDGRYGKWRFFSAMTGLGMFGISLLVNPEPASEEEEVQMKQKYSENKFSYIAERLGQTLHPVKHGNQFMGLGFLSVGVTSGICGLTQRAIYRAGGKVSSGYMKEVYAAVLSAAAGTGLILSTEDDKGWQRFGQIMPARLIFTVPRSMEVFKDQRDIWYGGGVASFQVMNLLSYLIGGTSEKTLLRHSGFAQRDEYGNFIVSDQRWKEKPLYKDYHEKAETVKNEVERRNQERQKGAAHPDEAHHENQHDEQINTNDEEQVRKKESHDVSDKSVENHVDNVEDTSSRHAGSKHASHESPNTEIREARSAERIKEAASQHVA